MNLEHFQKFLHKEIPVTAAQGVEVISFGIEGLRLRAPIANNYNDKRTAFAGSQYSLAVLAGWSYLMLSLDAAGLSGQVAVYKSSMDYQSPVASDYDAVCHPLPLTDLDKLTTRVKTKGRAKAELAVDLLGAQGRAATFAGHYAIQQILKSD